ncbi:MAG: hypothetical protein PVJ20_02080 [Desulfobacterales bacterium]|jgi:hypothetical protein
MSKNKYSISKKNIGDIEGIIVPVKWDEGGNPIAVSLATSREEELLINMKSAKARDLLELLQKKVRIAGSITKLDNDKKIITIRKYQQIAYDQFVPQSPKAEIRL